MNYANPSVQDTLLISLVGFATVFTVLFVLMLIIKLISAVFGKKAPHAPANPPSEPRPDKYGGVTLDGVDERTAAILMAIVADKLDRPLNELRFVSIREVK